MCNKNCAILHEIQTAKTPAEALNILGKHLPLVKINILRDLRWELMMNESGLELKNSTTVLSKDINFCYKTVLANEVDFFILNEEDFYKPTIYTGIYINYQKSH